jgi:broad specificity phosphatase PhoE
LDVGPRHVIGRQSMSLCLYLVRHGETEWSLSGRHTSRTDLPLTEQGNQEARKLAERLRAARIVRVFTSPRLRAQQTCALAELTPVAEIEPELAEWDYGDYEGLRSVEIRKRQPGWNLFRDGCPNGETPAQVSDRADRFIARLRALDGDVALFTHGHFGCVFAARWIELPVFEGRRFLLGTAALCILGFGPNDPEMTIIELGNH